MAGLAYLVDSNIGAQGATVHEVCAHVDGGEEEEYQMWHGEIKHLNDKSKKRETHMRSFPKV